jgi:hypothetical protein
VTGERRSPEHAVATRDRVTDTSASCRRRLI